MAAQGAAHPEPADTAESPGLLITWVRSYNLLVKVIFGGRRGALEAKLIRASGAGPGDRVLDVGCGPGTFARRLAKAVGPGGQVVGLDPSEPMVRYANRHAGRAANCRFVLGAAQSMDFPDETFDVVATTFAMHHIPEQHRGTALAHMYRVLRPGGRLLIADALPIGSVVHRMAHAVMRLVPSVRRHGGHDHGGQGKKAHPMSKADVRQYAGLLREIGFTEPRFTDVPPWVRYLVTEKPAG